MAVMAEIGRLICSACKVEDIYEQFFTEVQKIISFDRLTINFINHREGTYTINYAKGFDVPEKKTGKPYPLDGSVTNYLVRHRAGIIIDAANISDLFKKYPEITRNHAVRRGARSLMSVPLISRDGVFGVLHFRSKKVHSYTDRDLHLAEKIGQQIAGAIDSDRLHTALVQEAAMVAEIGRKVSSTLDIDEAYERLAAESGKLISYDLILVTLLDAQEAKFIVAYSGGDAPPDRKSGDSFLAADSIDELVMNKRAGVSIQAAAKNEFTRICHYADVASATATEMLSLMSAPLIANEDMIGVLHFRSKKPTAYTEQDLRLAEGIGRQIGGAIVNARLHSALTKQKEAEIALARSEMKYRTLFESAGDQIFVLRPDAQNGPIIMDANRAAIERYGSTREDLIGRSILELTAPAYRKKRRAIASRLINPGDKLVYEMDRLGKDQSAFPVEVSSQVVQIAGDPPFILAIERDVTERTRITAELNSSKEAAERLAQEMAIITEIGRKISSTLDIDEVYERLAFESGKLIAYDRLAVTRINAQEGIVTVNYVAGLVIPMRRVGDTFAVAGTMTEAVAKKQAGIIIQGADEDEIARRYPYRTVMRKGVLSVMCIPLIWQDRVIGVLDFRSKKPNAYTEQDFRLAEGIGQEIAEAIVNARLYTDLRKTEKALRESKEIYARLIEAIPDAVVQVDGDARIVFANEVALKMLGFGSIAELTTKDVLSFVVPEDRERAIEDMKLMKTKKLGPQSYRLIVEAGHRIDAEINANVLYNEDKSTFGNVLIYRDVTDSKRIEAALRTSEANYRFLADNMNDLIWTVDLDLRTTYINKSVEKLLGYSPEERIGKDFTLKFAPESYARIREIIAEQQERGKNGREMPDRVFTVEAEYYHKDGSLIWMESLISAMRDEHGALIGYLGVSRNITERKKLEQELRKVLDDLEQRVQDRTVELEEVNTALRVLLRKGEQDLKNMAHDIQGNLDRLVMPFLRRWEMSRSSEQSKTFAQIIETTLTNIVSPFLSRLSDSCKKLTPKELQTAMLIKEGKSSKEIAAIVGVSVGTVVTHRNNIRKKLKLTSRQINLRAHLLSLS